MTRNLLSRPALGLLPAGAVTAAALSVMVLNTPRGVELIERLLPSTSITNISCLTLLTGLLAGLVVELAGRYAAKPATTAVRQHRDGFPEAYYQQAQHGICVIDRDSLEVLHANPFMQKLGTDFRQLAGDSFERLRANIAAGAGLVRVERGEALFELSVSNEADGLVFLEVRDVTASLSRQERLHTAAFRREVVDRLLAAAANLHQHLELTSLLFSKVRELFLVGRPRRKSIYAQPENFCRRSGWSTQVARVLKDTLALIITTCTLVPDGEDGRDARLSDGQRAAAREWLRERDIRLRPGTWQPVCFTDFVDHLQQAVDELQEADARYAAMIGEQPSHARVAAPAATLPATSGQVAGV